MHTISNDTDLCKDTNQIDELSIIVSNDFTRLDKIEVYTQLNKLLFSEQWFHGHRVGGRWSEVWKNGREKPRTVTADAARRLVGPDAQTGANDAGGPIGRVAGLAAVRQQGARRKGSPVGLRPVEEVPVLHAERPRATWRQDKKKRARVKTLLCAAAAARPQ